MGSNYPYSAREIPWPTLAAQLSTRLCVVAVPGAGVTVRGVTVRLGN